MDDSQKTSDELLAEVLQLRRRITELETRQKDYEEAGNELKNARQRFEYLLAFSPAIIYTTQASGTYECTYVSENTRSIMGFAPVEMTTDAKFWPARLHPDDATRVFSEVSPLVEQGGGTVEYRFQHKDGHYVWIQDTFKVVYDDTTTGSPNGPDNVRQALELVGAWADITKRKEAERAALNANAELQETKRSLSRLIESSPDAIISTDRDGHIVLFNEGAETLLGYRADEMVGQSVTRIYGGEAAANEVLREMRKRGGTVSGFDSVLWAKDGTVIPVLISASLLFDEDGHQIGTVGFATDLRDRKRAQEELQRAYDGLEKRVEERTLELNEARGRLQYLLTVTPGIMYTNVPTDGYKCSFVSRNVDPIMGFSEWEMLEDPEFWPKRLHPDDVNRVFEEMGPLVEGGGGAIEYRFRHRDGHYVWIQDTFKVVLDDAGKPLEIVGSWADITHRKQVENALGERMALMNDLQTLVAASPAVIYTTQASGDFACTFVSDNLKTTMGYSPWEMREDTKFWLKRLHPDDVSRVFKELEDLIARGGGTIEYRFRHRRGHYIWIQDTFTATKDKDGNPKELIGSWADISDRKKIETELKRLAGEVEIRNRFIRETFGRYLTDEVVTTLLDSPSGLQMGGEKRKVTMLMADLRGFTSLSERMDPKWVVSILNRYLSSMVTIVKKYGGTVDEFIGDAVFVLFGAPDWHDDDAQRATACAVEMQLAMAAINEQNRLDGLPDVEMGIGLHTGQVIVGNIGSAERLKYGVVGSHVNLTSRIQSFTVGGQILVSETTRREVGRILKTGKQIEVRAKGFEHPVMLCEVLGIGGPHKLMLYQSSETLTELTDAIRLTCLVLEGGLQSDETFKGSFTRLGAKQAEVRFEKAVPVLSNLKLRLIDEAGYDVPGALYGKVVSIGAGGKSEVLIHFTSMSREIEAFLSKWQKKSVDETPMPSPIVPTNELAAEQTTLH
jgi:PAS domain S-box-containing protein